MVVSASEFNTDGRVKVHSESILTVGAFYTGSAFGAGDTALNSAPELEALAKQVLLVAQVDQRIATIVGTHVQEQHSFVPVDARTGRSWEESLVGEWVVQHKV